MVDLKWDIVNGEKRCHDCGATQYEAHEPLCAIRPCQHPVRRLKYNGRRLTCECGISIGIGRHELMRLLTRSGAMSWKKTDRDSDDA